MLATDLVTLLAAAGVGVAGGVNGTLFTGSKAVIPGGTVASISIVDTGGASPVRTQTGQHYRRPSVQIVARAPSDAVAVALAEAAYNAIVNAPRTVDAGWRGIVLNGHRYRELNPVQEPFDGGLDSASRPQTKFNVNAVVS
jgi:hypothetical protein